MFVLLKYSWYFQLCKNGHPSFASKLTDESNLNITCARKIALRKVLASIDRLYHNGLETHKKIHIVNKTLHCNNYQYCIKYWYEKKSNNTVTKCGRKTNKSANVRFKLLQIQGKAKPKTFVLEKYTFRGGGGLVARRRALP